MSARPQTGWKLGEGVPASGRGPGASDAAALPSVDLGSEGGLPGWYGGLPPWLRRWAPPATLAAMGVSLLIHLVLLAIAAAVVIGGAQAGGGGAGAGDAQPIGVAIMTEAELGEISGGAALDADAPAVAEIRSTELPGGDPSLNIADGLGAIEPGGLGEGIGELTSGLGAGDVGSGQGLGTGGAGGGAASFFGVEARGSRFAYIIDISGSMETGLSAGDGTRMTVLKRELGKSIDALMETARFFVAMFSDAAEPLGGRMEWVQASALGKSQTRKLISNIVSQGSTNPLPAFELVFRMRPRPDAIYFMTDGEFDPDVELKVARLNAEYRVPIHCITFISDGGREVMQRIAEASGGTYAHVPGPRP